jgi:DNA polymerase V
MTPMFQPTLDNNSSRLDLYNLVSHHPDATFFVKYEGSDLCEFNIFKNDILVIDRSIKPKPGKIATLIKDDEFIIDKIGNNKTKQEIWGVISFVIHKS